MKTLKLTGAELYILKCSLAVVLEARMNDGFETDEKESKFVAFLKEWGERFMSEKINAEIAAYIEDSDKGTELLIELMKKLDNKEKK